MKKEEIHFGDINRWVFGQTPPEFMLEVFIRTILIFLLLLLAVRLMGKRMSGQITLTELAVMVTLGAIVSPISQLPDRGLVFGVVALSCTVTFQRGITWLGFKSRKVEEVTQGEMSLLVKDGRVDLEELEKTHITKQQLFSMLREKKIQNLGKVERAYLEACGIFTVYETEGSKTGLPIFPPTDPDILQTQHSIETTIAACCNCGHVQSKTGENTNCELCNSNGWSKAYLSN